MSCGANRCALRRFDGHGSSSYRPTNPDAAKVFNTSMQSMLAERARQDAGTFTMIPLQQSQQSQPSQQVHPTSQQLQQSQQSQQLQQSQQVPETFYSLSDSSTLTPAIKHACPK